MPPQERTGGASGHDRRPCAGKDTPIFDSRPLLVLILIFLASGTVIWIAGIRLSETTDILSSRFHLGQALGGLIPLAIVTNLPEIAITNSASHSGPVEIAVGNTSAASASRRSCSSRWTSLASARVTRSRGARPRCNCWLRVSRSSRYWWSRSFLVLCLYLLGVAGLVAVAHG